MAQFVCLNSKEINALKELINNNSAVNKVYKEFKYTADSALNSNSDPRDTIVSEGHLNNHPDKIASVRSMNDIISNPMEQVQKRIRHLLTVKLHWTQQEQRITKKDIAGSLFDSINGIYAI
ncbi:MAG: hypothetical protein ABIP30_17305 [Ferruginibacter sp.]